MPRLIGRCAQVLTLSLVVAARHPLPAQDTPSAVGPVLLGVRPAFARVASATPLPQVHSFDHFAAYVPACWLAARQTRCAVIVEGVSGGTVEGVLRIRGGALAASASEAVRALDRRSGAGVLSRVDSPCAVCGAVRVDGLPRHSIRVDYISFDSVQVSGAGAAVALHIQEGTSTGASAVQRGAPSTRHELVFDGVQIFADESAAAQSLVSRIAAWPAPMEQVALALRPSALARVNTVPPPGDRREIAIGGSLVASLTSCQQTGSVVQCRATFQNAADSIPVNEAIIRIDGVLANGRTITSTGGQNADTVEIRRWGDVRLRLAARASAAVVISFRLPVPTDQLAAIVMYFRGVPGRDLSTVPRFQFRVPAYGDDRR